MAARSETKTGESLNNVRCRVAAISGGEEKRREHMKDEFNELSTRSNKKNIRDLYRGSDLVICLQIPTTF
jgi:hypothetical protein